MNTSELRELDAKVAEFMGCTPREKSIGHNVTILVCSCSNREHEDRLATMQGILAYYSTDISAAWQVVEKFIEHHDFDLNNLLDNNGDWMATIKPLNSNDFVFAKAPTAPEAICLAALKTKECKDE